MIKMKFGIVVFMFRGNSPAPVALSAFLFPCGWVEVR